MDSGFSANVENKKDGIEISNLESNGNYKYDSAQSILNFLLYNFVRPYSKIHPQTKEGKKALEATLKEDIEKTKQKLAEQQLALKMCQRKKVYFKPKQS
jgi:hypothetical protein